MRSAVFQTILLRPVGVESDVRPLTCTITELVGLVAGHDRSEEIGTDLAEQTSDVAPTAAAAELWFPIASHNWESYRQSSEGPDEVCCLQTILLRPGGVESDVRSLSPIPEPPQQRLRSSGSQSPPTTGRANGRAARGRMRSAAFQTILLLPVGMESDVRPLTCTITELVGLVAGHDRSEEIGTDLAEQTSDVAPTAAAAELWFPIASHNWENYRQSSESPDEVCCLPDHPPASCGGGKRRQAPLTHTRAPTAAAAELWFPIASHDWESYRQSSEGPDEVCCLQTILLRPVGVEGDARPLTRTRAPTAAAAELWFPIASHDWESYRQSSEGPDEVRCLPDHPPASCGGGKRRQAPLTHTRAPTAAAAELWFPLVPRLGSGPLRSAPVCSGLLRVCSGSAPVCSGLLRVCSGSAPVCSGLLRSALDLLWICSGSALDLLWICSGSAPVRGAGMVSRTVAIPLASL